MPEGFTLHLTGGPLDGQAIIVHPGQSGVCPPVVYAHAPLPPDHEGVPAPLHRYLARGDGRELAYVHAPDCGGCAGVDTPHHGG